MKRRKFVIFIVILVCLAGFAAGEVRFSQLDLSDENKLLFLASAEMTGSESYDTGFMASLEPENGAEKIEQFTFFPEKLTLLKGGSQLQIQNRFGVFRTDKNLSSPKPIEKEHTFVNGGTIEAGKLNPVTASPNGKYLVYTNKKSCAYGSLILYDVEKQNEVTISKQIEISLEGDIVAWAPNSSMFIYTKNGKLFYYSITQYKEERVLSEDFREVGDGSLSSVYWNKDNELFYLQDNLVYKVYGVEVFTRALYTDVLAIGDVVGKIPFSFDPNFDEFWISSDDSNIVLSKGKSNLFLYKLDNSDFTTAGEGTSLPYLMLPRNTKVKKVIWSEKDILTVFTVSYSSGAISTALYRLNVKADKETLNFTKIDDTNVGGISLSPEESSIALIKENSVIIKDYETWKTKSEINIQGAMHALWSNSNTVVVAGSQFIKKVDIKSGKETLVAVSQPDTLGYTTDAGKVAMKTGSKAFIKDDAGSWAPADSFSVRKPSTANADFRIYLDSISKGAYVNMVMVRSISGYGTEALFTYPAIEYEPFPDTEEKVNMTQFTHGSRIRRREIALVFNAIDSVEGLRKVLNTLNSYGIKATFFVNGRFIRRHPEAVKEIAKTEHEVGSLFYTYFNMSDTRYTVDKKYIKQGLARNEDEYYGVTGQELSLLWHTPHYFINQHIIEASRDLNYTYVGRDVDSLDWVTKKGENQVTGLYKPVGELIERIIKLKKPGSIIPIRIGIPDGGREDYLFEKIDVLINCLIRKGYSIVPVSTLMQHAR